MTNCSSLATESLPLSSDEVTHTYYRNVYINLFGGWGGCEVISQAQHDDVIEWNSPHKGQRRGALMFSLIRAWINGWVNSDEAGDLRRHDAHYDITVMKYDTC